MKSSLTVGQLREAIKNLPDDLPVYAANHWLSEREDECYYLTQVQLHKKTPISNEHLNLQLGEEFGW